MVEFISSLDWVIKELGSKVLSELVMMFLEKNGLKADDERNTVKINGFLFKKPRRHFQCL